MNPLLARELRVRFRDNRSFWLLLGLTAALCLAAGWIYWDAVQWFNPNDFGVGTGNTTYGVFINQASETGRQLFRFLAMGNVAAWLLIAPALTATGLAKERERGLLESLWLSPFKVKAQILGRLGATLCFLFILQVAVLPIYGIALLLGGVSPGEIGLAGLVIGMTALFGASLGLWCSARVYRSANALGSVFVLIAVWSFVAFIQIDTLTRSASLYWLEFALFFSHPVAVLYYLLSPEEFSSFVALPFGVRDVAQFGLAFPAVTSLLMLWSATRSASKPLADLKWSEGNPLLNRWRTQLDTIRHQRKEQRERARAREAVAGALLYEFPFEKFVRFKDPLLAREVRARFRVRQGGLFVSLLRLSVLVAAGSFWLIVVFSIFDRTSRGGAGEGLLNGLLTFGILAVAVMSSTSVTREREGGTWEGLRLSLISPPALLRSKWLSPIITFLYWSVPLWILLPLCINWTGKQGVPLFWLLAGILMVLATLGTVSAWGLWISRRATHSAAATSWTLATLLILLMGAPALDSMVGVTEWVGRHVYYAVPPARGPESDEMSDYAQEAFENGEERRRIRLATALANTYHPFIALNEVLGAGNNYDEPPSRPAARFSVLVLHLFLNGAFTGLLLYRVAGQVKKIEQ
jgi:hypothetical protein